MIGGFTSQRASNTEICYFLYQGMTIAKNFLTLVRHLLTLLYCWPEQAVKQTVQLLVILDTFTLMWYQCNVCDIRPHYASLYWGSDSIPSITSTHFMDLTGAGHRGINLRIFVTYGVPWCKILIPLSPWLPLEHRLTSGQAGHQTHGKLGII